MEFTKKDPYIKQIGLYMENGQSERAYALAQDFADKFKQELAAHFLLAKTAFRLKKFSEAVAAARTAFNLATSKQDMVTCALVLSASYYVQGEIDEAYKVLHKVGGEGDSDVEKLMFIYASSVKEAAEATQHLDRLYQINPRLADRFIQRFF